MGKKYRRYRNALEKYLASDRGRRFFHIAYSLGAAVVILGALFKINHYPYSSEILLVAMCVEAVVFFLSAFDRPVRDYQWEEVFPEFATPEQLERKAYFEQKNKLKKNASTTISTDGETTHVSSSTSSTSGVQSGGDAPDMPLTANQGTIVGTSGQSAVSGNVMSTYYPSTPSEVENEVAKAPSEVPTTEKETTIMGEIPSVAPAFLSADLTSASENYVNQVNKMSENVEKFNAITQSLNNVSEVLMNSFKHITDNSEGIGTSTKGYVFQMESLNKNISGLNTIYEIQLKGVSSQISAIDEINAGLNRIKNLYEGTIPDSTVFRSETEKLASQLKDLNQVYARMLQAMTVNMNMGGMGGFPHNPGQTGNTTL